MLRSERPKDKYGRNGFSPVPQGCSAITTYSGPGSYGDKCKISAKTNVGTAGTAAIATTAATATAKVSSSVVLTCIGFAFTACIGLVLKKRFSEKKRSEYTQVRVEETDDLARMKFV